MAGRHSLRVVISAGPTREPIDSVRFISNYSTGYIGAQLAAQALARGHRVTVISGPGLEPLPSGARVIPVERAMGMERALRAAVKRADVVVMAAAVADFAPARAATAKLPRRGQLTLRLRATPDIIGRLPRRKAQLVVGFAVEDQPVLPRAKRKLRAKRLDLLVAQRLDRTGAPFGRRTMQAWLLAGDRARTGTIAVTALGRRSKPAVARVLLDKIEALWYGQTGQRTRRNGRGARGL